MGELRDEMAEAVASGTYTTRLPGKPAPQWCYDVAEMVVKIERERARQRIEALDRITSDYDGASGFLATDVFKALADE